ncbi:MAG: formylglycine-generating enzyme family protein [Nitrospirales bacterium]
MKFFLTVAFSSVLLLSNVFTTVVWSEETDAEQKESPSEEVFELGSMILIPAGEFKMGDNEGRRNERPDHVVWLDDYFINRFEVTMSEYQKFLDEHLKLEPPPLWDDGMAFGEGADRPAVGVTWEAANKYCRWAGRRLPTEAEWEKAARGTDGRRYPWGHMQPFVDIARYNHGITGWVSYTLTLASVRSGVKGMSIRHGLKTGGKSPYGLYHMSGNAAEWVADWYGRYYYEDSPKKNPQGPESGDRKVLRGGSWEDEPRRIRVTVRAKAEPEFSDLTIGFRCAKDKGASEAQ